jgi:His/Glu/Gln/Arg/opine family amino acid ABC transporter permease subunit
MPAMPLPDLIGYGEQLLAGAVITVKLAFSGYALALAVGVTWALLRQVCNSAMSPVILGVWRVYASIFMGVPSVLVLFLFYFGGSAFVAALFGLAGLRVRVDVTPFAAGLAALTIVQGAYSAEVVSGAIRNVPRGQFEAARALGIRSRHAWWYVIMPQVARLALPGLVNIWVSVLKDTSLVALAGLNEIVARSRTAAGATKEPFLFFIAAALFFILFSSATLKLSARLERRLDRGTARPATAGRGA